MTLRDLQETEEYLKRFHLPTPASALRDTVLRTAGEAQARQVVTHLPRKWLWAAAAVVWIVGTVSALAAFPPLISTTHTAANNGIFIAARDAYLARDWLLAETKLRALLIVSPTDGEAQLLLATLLRRVGRNREARAALETLSRSDSGAAWNSAIGRELIRLDAPEAAPDANPEGSIVPLAATYNATPAGEAAA